MSGGPFLYPSVTSLPGQSGVSADRPSKLDKEAKGEFDKVFDQVLNEPRPASDLGQIKAPLKFSAHASQRLNDRKINLDQNTMSKVNDAVDKAAAKGLED